VHLAKRFVMHVYIVVMVKVSFLQYICLTLAFDEMYNYAILFIKIDIVASLSYYIKTSIRCKGFAANII
jgi:hypothetical protein